MSRKRGPTKPRTPKVRRLPPDACNGCGGCCDPVVLAIGPETLRGRPDLIAGMDPREAEWILNELVPVATPSSVPYGETPQAGFARADGKTILQEAQFYRCLNYDRETRACRRYADRPRVCRDYPWGREAPDPRAAIPAACEFNRDVGREPVPVTITPRRP